MVKNLPSNAGDAGSIPDRETKVPPASGQQSPSAHAPQLRSHMLQLRPNAAKNKKVNTFKKYMRKDDQRKQQPI